MKTLDRKLMRDLWEMKGQVFAISLIILSGISTFVLFLSIMDALSSTRARFYSDYRFADVFASLKRAPEEVRHRIFEIPGVERVETRVVADIKLDIKGFNEPVTARVVSVPDDGKPLLNGLYMRSGRGITFGEENEVIVGEAFAEAHGFRPGDSFGAIINGRWKDLIIAGIALSPEYVLQIKMGSLSPDAKKYGILWMSRRSLETAYDMKGAFNDVSLTLAPGAQAEDVIATLDSIIAPYGGIGSYSRKDQLSNRYLSEEFRQLERSAQIFPAIFIGVAAFLLNIVISRLISTQREQIATLKAFGYGNMDVGLHYVKMVVAVALLGFVFGIGTGVWLGNALGRLYMEFFRFPYLDYKLRLPVILWAAVISFGSALAGTVYSVRKAALEPPAQAMRPEPPAVYRMSFLERIGMMGFLSQPARMIIRNLERRPVKSVLTILGIAFACSIMVMGRFSKDAIDYMLDVQFRQSWKEDLAVTFIEPTSRNAVHEIENMKGVRHAEVFRSVPVRLRHGHRSYRTSIQGVEQGNTLHLLLDSDLKPIKIKGAGIVLTDYLANNILEVRPGDNLTVEVLEGSRPVREVQVTALVKQDVGVSGFMDMTELNRLLGEGDAISGVFMTVDPVYQNEIYKGLVEAPRVGGVSVTMDEYRNFYEMQAEALLMMTFVATLLAGSISVGVVYNSARIALSERSRDLASLRVLGFTRGEISYILLGELALLTAVAIPIGFEIGRGLCTLMAVMLQSDLYRVPVVIGRKTYALASSVVLVSAFVSGIVVRHRLDHLDLVAVLKTKE